MREAWNRARRAIAVDLGAESCRVSLGEWDGAAANVRLVHRFPNGPVERDGHLYWDLEGIVAGVEEGLRRAAEQASGPVDALGVDGWAVDYVRLDAAGQPLAPPFCYRDPRTETAMPEVWQRTGRERLYELTGIQFLRFNTLYQLHADRRDGLPAAALWLNIPEYVLHRLGAPPVSEYTNATHTQLVDAQARAWCDEVFQKAGLDRRAAPPIVAPGTRLCRLRPWGEPLSSLAAFAATELIAPACHDTGAAVAGIADPGWDWAFISSGTWSLAGTVLEEPNTSPEAREANFTNEGGVGGRIRFLKNVNGMWLIEECLRAWRERAEMPSWSAEQLAEACARRPVPAAVFDVDAPQLLAPGNMPVRINDELRRAGFAPLPDGPQQPVEMAAVIFASLAARYADVIGTLARLTGRTFRRLYIVGGGSRNEHLNRLVAERTGLRVVRGPVESSTIGNLAIQFAALEGDGQPVSARAVAAWAARLAR